MTEWRGIGVIADDLTGAAEIAGVAHRRGFSAAIVLDARHAPADCEALIFDSDTRLLRAEEAAVAVRDVATAMQSSCRDRFFYKKTDSVLRGNVRTEVEELAAAWQRTRVLLVPANPSQGRTIHQGIYRIGEVPLAETEFAHDPHHPARSSVAVELLGAGAMSVVNVSSGNAALPEHAIVLGDAASADDLARWTARVDETTLPAGGREFFESCLASWDSSQALDHGSIVGPSLAKAAVAASGDPTSQTLIISGSAADAAKKFVSAARTAGVRIVGVVSDDAAAVAACVDELHAALSTHGIACAVIDHPLDPDRGASRRFAAALASLARELFARRAFRHLVLEGGATAAAVLRALDVTALRVTGEWAPGVVALRTGELEVTMKPGSYSWPENLTHALLSRG